MTTRLKAAVRPASPKVVLPRRHDKRHPRAFILENDDVKILAIALLGSAVALSGCGGGGDSGSANDITLSAGQSVTLSAGETAMVPSGVTVNDHGSTVTVNGHHNTINVHAGAVVTVPAGASGAADNSVVAQ